MNIFEYKLTLSFCFHRVSLHHLSVDPSDLTRASRGTCQGEFTKGSGLGDAIVLRN